MIVTSSYFRTKRLPLKLEKVLDGSLISWCRYYRIFPKRSVILNPFWSQMDHRPMPIIRCESLFSLQKATSRNRLLTPSNDSPISPLVPLQKFVPARISSLIRNHHFTANISLISHPISIHGVLPHTFSSPVTRSLHISFGSILWRSRLSRRPGIGIISMQG